MSETKNLPAQTELVASIKTLPELSGNFDEVRAYFVEELKKYDVVVTLETLPDAKKLATELNKAATEVKSRGKVVSNEAAAPIKLFDDRVKELAQLLLDARTKLTEQVKTFEDETRAKALAALQAYLVERGAAKGVRPQFQRATVEDIVRLDTLTKIGNLSGKAKAEVDARIAADLALQQQTDMRLVMLENESLKAGLAAPLTQNHVELFLCEPDDVYKMRLAHLFEAELQREVKARAAAEQRAADEQRRNAEAQQRAAEQKARADQMAEQNRLLQEQQEQQRQHQAEQLRLQQEQHQRELAAAKANLAQQAPTVASQAGADVGAVVQAALAPSNEFVIAPVMQVKADPTRFTGDDSGALHQALQVASSAGHAEVWRKGQPAQLVAVVLTGQAAIDYRNAVKAGA